MDEAERCNRIVYLSDGRIVVQGSADDVVRRSALVIFETVGEGIDDVARRIRRMPGVEAAAVFGHALRVAGVERERLRRAVGAFAGFDWHEAEPRLEDVFIHQLAAGDSAK